MSDTQLQYAIEGSKLQAEFTKHITTLSTGSIILMATFLEKLFANPKWKLCVAVSFAGFIMAILVSLILFFLAVGVAEGNLELNDPNLSKWQVRLLATLFVSFLVGILSLSAFFLKNFI